MDGLRKEFQDKKKEVSQLRAQLNSLNQEKEKYFRELRSARDKIKSRAQKIKALKESRDNLTKQVKETKVERDKLNDLVKSKVGVKKEVDKKKHELLESLKIKNDPVSIKIMIEQLETKIETEVMPFSKEQQLNKKIKELKAQLKELQSLGVIWKEISTTSQDFSETKRKAEESHQNVQDLAKQSQEKHQNINQLYEELKELRNSEQPLAEKYLEFKVKYEETKKSLDELQVRINELSKILNIEDERNYKDKVREKTAEVAEKIKKGKKLTTADILAFQATRE